MPAVMRTPLQLAQAQLAGGKLTPDGSMICRLCGSEVFVKPELEACAFCDDCKDKALDVLAEVVVQVKVQLRRSHR